MSVTGDLLSESDISGAGIFDYLFQTAQDYKRKYTSNVVWEDNSYLFRGVIDCQYYMNIFCDVLIDPDNSIPLVRELLKTNEVDNVVIAAYLLKE